MPDEELITALLSIALLEQSSSELGEAAVNTDTWKLLMHPNVRQQHEPNELSGAV